MRKTVSIRYNGMRASTSVQFRISRNIFLSNTKEKKIMEERRLCEGGGGASDGIREGLNKNQEDEMKLFF